MSKERHKSRRYCWILAVMILLPILGLDWKSTVHTCQTCGGIRTSTSVSVVYWLVYANEESTMIGDDHEHKPELTLFKEKGGPIIWLSE